MTARGRGIASTTICASGADIWRDWAISADVARPTPGALHALLVAADDARDCDDRERAIELIAAVYALMDAWQRVQARHDAPHRAPELTAMRGAGSTGWGFLRRVGGGVPGRPGTERCGRRRAARHG